MAPPGAGGCNGERMHQIIAAACKKSGAKRGIVNLTERSDDIGELRPLSDALDLDILPKSVTPYFHLLGDDSEGTYNGHHPDCSVDSTSCSRNMYTKENLSFPLCAWHAIRIGNISTINCGCDVYTAVSGDSFGRKFVRDILDKAGIAHYDKHGVCDMVFEYCCANCCSTNDYTHTCGDMKICKYCLHHHDSHTLYERE